MTVAFDFPLAHRQMVAFPFHGLVLDEFVAQLLAERRLDQRVGGKGCNRLLQRLRQEVDIARPPLLLGDGVEIVLVGIAGIDMIADAFQPGGQRQRGGKIRIDRAICVS